MSTNDARKCSYKPIIIKKKYMMFRHFFPHRLFVAGVLRCRSFHAFLSQISSIQCVFSFLFGDTMERQ